MPLHADKATLNAALDNREKDSSLSSKQTSSQEGTRSASERRIRANRENALRSTGPKTARGKANVRFNALKDGFFSKQVVISSKFVGEDSKEFEVLLNQLRQEYKPVGIMEDLCVQRIAVCFWRERRALRSEMGEVQRARQNAQEEYKTTERNHPAVVECMIEALEKARVEAQETGQFSRETVARLRDLFEDQLLDLGTYRICSPELLTTEPKDRSAWQAESLRTIDETIRYLHIELYYAQYKRKRATELAQERYALPPSPELDRILRYQALNDRRLQRALTQLERLQQQRKGESVTPPVKNSVEGREGNCQGNVPGLDGHGMEKMQKQSQEVL
ncbi:MAG TPA: hypothetical protein VFJ47_14775 [Terriglobales bacterium]|nr:hypothetical protein [Terriglobales bacterium]